MKAAIYIRWSTEDQGHGTTLQVQREACLAYCDRHGCYMGDDRIFIDDGYSGGTLQRPAMDKLRAAVLSGEVDTVVVYRLDRLSRDLADATGLVGREWKGRAVVRSATEDVHPEADEGWLNYSFRAAFADYERRVIRQRTYAGKVRRIKEGLKVTGKTPYGYRKGEKTGTFDVDPEQAEAVQRMFERCALENVGLPALARWLNEMGYKPPRAEKWSAGILRPMLMNPVYKGHIVYGRQKFLKKTAAEPGPWRVVKEADINVKASPDVLPPLVSDELWEQAQAAMAKRRSWMEQTSGRSLGSNRLLTGLLFCKCGSRLEVKTQGARRPGSSDYYRCIHNEQRERCPHNPGYISVEILDQIVTDQVLARIRSEGFKEALEGALSTQVREEVALLQRRRLEIAVEMDKLERELRHIDKEYRQERLTIEEARRMRGQVEEERVELARTLAEVEGGLADHQREERERRGALGQVELADRWDELEMPQRRQVLQQFIRRIEALRVQAERDLSVHLVWAIETGNEAGELMVHIPRTRKAGQRDRRE